MALALTYTAALGFAGAISPLNFVQKNCSTCHNASVSSGGINFAAYSSAATFSENRDVWERVLAKVKAGEMPPPGMPKPPAADTKAVTDWLESEFARQDKDLKPDAGPIAARRLSRSEYNNTMRDLLGVDLKPADSFPQDQAAFGFENISDALKISSVLLEKYADAAERCVRTAIFGPELLKPSVAHYPFIVRIYDLRGTHPTPIPDAAHYDLTGLSTPHSGHTVHRFPVDGVYNFRLVLNGHRPNQSMPAHPALWIDSKLVHEFEVDATDLEGQIVEARAKVTAGEHLISLSYLREYDGLPPSYHGPNPSTRPPVALISTKGPLTQKDIETLRKTGTKIKTDSIEKRIDNRFESVDVIGPFEQATGPAPETLRHIFVCGHKPGHHNASCPRIIINHFATRAFRRPLQPKEAQQYLALYRLVRKQGDSFEEGIAAALEGILVSPKFLYRMEQDQQTGTGVAMIPVNEYEFASRLSYFLWSSTPDAELMRLAGRHRLSEPGVLEAQVLRMLRDKKSSALVDDFAGEWLQFRNLDLARPDNARFRDFDDDLRYSMRRETELFVENIIRQNRSVLEFLDADYTFLNERLARFYGIPGISGPEFRRVDMGGTQRGGGVLAQASILTITSYATRTSPVLRGKWILETLLDAPPPPPPPAVPALDDSKVGESVSLRQQMEVHRKNPVCATCHTKMDPLGFGLENLNAIGAWRDKDGKLPVDASGSLPNGSTFHGPKELKQFLLTDRDRFVAALTEKLMIYALGRGLERYDRPELKKIEERLAANNYRFSQLVMGIVESLPFQMRRSHEANLLTARSQAPAKE